ncbi:uncharacterized protein LOC136028315 isoform X2 [Artemia franciscana]|nr:hypothetical protein QYM36_014098 [Artemia franciscana]
MNRGRRRPNSTTQTLWTSGSQTMRNGYQASPPPSAWMAQNLNFFQSPGEVQAICSDVNTSKISEIGMPDKFIRLLDEVHSENRRLHETITSLREKNVAYEQAVENLQARTREREAEFQEELFQTRTSKLAESRHHALENIEMQRLKRELRQKAAYSQDLELQIKEYQQKIEAYEKTMDQLTTENNILLGKLSAEEKKCRTLKFQSDNCSSLQQRIRELNDTVRDLTEELLVLRNINNELTNSCPEQKTERRDNEREKKTNEILKTTEEELQSEKKRYEDLLQKSQEEHKKKLEIEEKLNELRVALSIYEDTVKTKDIEIEKCKKEVVALNAKLKEISIELNSQINQLQREVDGKETLLKEVHSEVTHYRGILQVLEDQLKEKTGLLKEFSNIRNLIEKNEKSKESLSHDQLLKGIKEELCPLIEKVKKIELSADGKSMVEQLVQTDPEKVFLGYNNKKDGGVQTSPNNSQQVIPHNEKSCNVAAPLGEKNFRVVPETSKLKAPKQVPIPKPRTGTTENNQKQSLTLPKREHIIFKEEDSSDESDASVESVKFAPRVSEQGCSSTSLKKEKYQNKEGSNDVMKSKKVVLNVISKNNIRKASSETDISSSESIIDQKYELSDVNSHIHSDINSDVPNGSKSSELKLGGKKKESSLQQRKSSVSQWDTSYSESSSSELSLVSNQEKRDSKVPTPGKARNDQESVDESSMISDSDVSYSETLTETSVSQKNLQKPKIQFKPSTSIKELSPKTQKPKKFASDPSDSETVVDSNDEQLSTSHSSYSEISRSSSRTRRKISSGKQNRVSSPKADAHISAEDAKSSSPSAKALQSQLGVHINHVTIFRGIADSRYSSIYVEGDYLDIPVDKLETESVPLKQNTVVRIDFRTIIKVDGNRRKLFVENLKKNTPIRFTVIAEPKPEFDETLDCIELGVGAFSMIELLKRRSDIKNFNIDILDVNKESKIGILNISVYAFRLLSSLATEFKV